MKTWTEGLLELLVAIAAEHYPAFKKPSRPGAPRRSTWSPLALWQQAHEARLVQLFDLTKKARGKTAVYARLKASEGIAAKAAGRVSVGMWS
jgi:hypothetical protein